MLQGFLSNMFWIVVFIAAIGCTLALIFNNHAFLFLAAPLILVSCFKLIDFTMHRIVTPVFSAALGGTVFAFKNAKLLGMVSIVLLVIVLIIRIGVYFLRKQN